jgi:ribosomal protein S6
MKYELTFLLIEETELKNNQRVINHSFRKSYQGRKLGQKTLSYPIKKARSAFYYHWKIEIDKKM